MAYDDLIRKYADRYGIKPEIAQRMFSQESNFDPNAVSNKGAQGLGQLMPDTAKSLGVTNINDPEQNIEASLRYLKQQLDRNNGDYNLALASYNAGPGAVAKYGGIPPFKETQDYVNRINPPTSIDWGSVAEPPKIDWDAAAAAPAEERRPELGEGAEHIGPRADNPVVNWFEDLKGDVRAGTGITAPGRLLQKMGSSGAGYTPESNIVAGPFVGPPEAGHGVSKLIDPDSSGMERVRGANEGVAGVAKTVAPILGVTNPAFLPTVVGYGAVGEAAHKGAELFTDDPDKQELASNLAMIAAPGGKRLMGPAGDFVSKAAPITGKAVGIGTGLYKSIRTANPAWLLSGMPPITGAVTKAADLTGKGMRGFSDLHPLEGSTPAVSSFAEKNNDASRIVDSGPIAKFTGTGTFRGKMGMDQFAPPERLNPKLTAGPIITPPPEPTVDTGPMARPAASQLVRGPGGKMVKQFLTSTAEKGAKAKPAVPLPPNPLSIPQESAPLIETPKAMPEQTVSAGGTGALSSEEVNRGNHVLIDEQGNVKQHLGKQPDLSSKTPEAGKGAIVELNPDNSPKRVVSGRSDIDTSKIQEALKQTSQPAGTQLGPQETQSAVDEAIKSMKPPSDEEAGGLAVKPEGPEVPPLVDASSLELDSMDQPKSWEEVPSWENPVEHGDGRGYGDEEGTNDLIQGFEDRSVSGDVNLEKWWANQEPKIEGEVPPEDKFPKSNMEDIFNVAQAWVKSRPRSTREEFVSRFTPRGREAAGQAFDAAKGAEHMEQNPSSLIDDSSLKIPSSEELYPTGENWDAQNRKFNEILERSKKNPQEANAKAWLADQKDLLNIANQKGDKVEADKIQKGIDDFLGGNERLIQTEPLTTGNKSDKIKNMANPDETPKSPEPHPDEFIENEFKKRFPGQFPDVEFDHNTDIWTVKVSGKTYEMQVGSDDDNFIFENTRDPKDLIEFDFPEGGFEQSDHLVDQWKDALIDTSSIEDVAKPDENQEPVNPDYDRLMKEFRGNLSKEEQSAFDKIDKDIEPIKDKLIAEFGDEGHDIGDAADTFELIANQLSEHDYQSQTEFLDSLAKHSGIPLENLTGIFDKIKKINNENLDIQAPPLEEGGQFKIYLDEGRIGTRPSQTPGMVEMGVEINGDVHIYEIPTEVWEGIKKQGFLNLNPTEGTVPRLSPGADKDVKELERMNNLVEPPKQPAKRLEVGDSVLGNNGEVVGRVIKATENAIKVRKPGGRNVWWDRENLEPIDSPEEENKNPKGTGVSKSSKKDWFDDIPEAIGERKLPDEMTKTLDKDTDFFHGSGHDATKTGLKPNMSEGIQAAFDDGEIEMPEGAKPEDFKGIHLATTPERAFFYGPRIHKITLPAGTKVTVDPLDTDSIIHHSEIKPEDIKTTDLNSHPMNFNGKPIEHVGDKFKLHLTSEDVKELKYLQEEIDMVTETSTDQNSLFGKAKSGGQLSFTKKQLKQFADRWNEWIMSDNRDHDAGDFSSNITETLVRLAHREGFEVGGHFFSEDRFVKNNPMIKRSGRSRDDILEDQDITNRMRQDLENQGHTAEKVRIARVKPDVGKKTGKTYAETLQERGIDTGDDKPLVDEPRAPIPASKATTKKQALAEVNKLFDDDVINAEEYQNRLREIEHRFRTNQ